MNILMAYGLLIAKVSLSEKLMESIEVIGVCAAVTEITSPNHNFLRLTHLEGSLSPPNMDGMILARWISHSLFVSKISFPDLLVNSISFLTLMSLSIKLFL